MTPPPPRRLRSAPASGPAEAPRRGSTAPRAALPPPGGRRGRCPPLARRRDVEAGLGGIRAINSSITSRWRQGRAHRPCLLLEDKRGACAIGNASNGLEPWAAGKSPAPRSICPDGLQPAICVGQAFFGDMAHDAGRERRGSHPHRQECRRKRDTRGLTPEARQPARPRHRRDRHRQDGDAAGAGRGLLATPACRCSPPT